jgi:hypothetical protein
MYVRILDVSEAHSVSPKLTHILSSNDETDSVLDGPEHLQSSHSFADEFTQLKQYKFEEMLLYKRYRHSSIGIATGYGLDDCGSRVRFAARAANSSPPYRVQTGSEAH